MQQDAYSSQIAQAWGQLVQGGAKAASDGFEQILKSAPDHVDARFGLALAQKALGKTSDAKSSLERCLEQTRTSRQAEPANDRHMMLERIIQQRIKELGAG
jgi:Tfp pilus assembly protein PilF